MKPESAGDANLSAGGAAVSDVVMECLAAAFDLEQVDGFEQVAELGVAVVARIEGSLLDDVVADCAEVRPAVFFGGGFDGFAQQVDEAGVAFEFFRGLAAWGRCCVGSFGARCWSSVAAV